VSACRGRRDTVIYTETCAGFRSGRRKKRWARRPTSLFSRGGGPQAHLPRQSYLKIDITWLMTPYRYAEALVYVVDTCVVSTM
jgi:hypothetical protein